MRRYLDICCIVVLIVLVGIFFRKVGYGKFPIPTDTLIGMYHPWLDYAATTNPSGVPFKNFLITDPVRQQIPWRKIVIDQIKSGHFIDWNPYNFSGTSLIGNIQSGALYPINIVFFFLPLIWAWTFLIMAQPLLAGVLFYIYLRSKGIDPFVSLLGALIWAFCGFSIAWLTWGTIIHVALWLPGILLFQDRVVSHGRWIDMACLAGMIAMTMLAGHTQVAMYVLVLAVFYGLDVILVQHGKSWPKLFASWVMSVIIASIIWIPMLSTFANSSRATDTTSYLKEGWFLPWQHLVQFVAPDFFGNPATLNYWGAWNYGEFIGYIGMLPLLFAFYGAFQRYDRSKNFFLLALVGALVFLLPTPLATLPFILHIPIISTLQPTRLMVIVDVCLVFLSSYGAQMFFKKPDKKIFFPVVCVGLVLGGLWLWLPAFAAEHSDVSKRNLILPTALWTVSSVLLLSFFFLKKWKQILVIVCTGFVAFDLFRFGWKFIPFTPGEYFFPVTETISFLLKQTTPYRIATLDNRIMPPNVNAYYGIESAEGYDPVYSKKYEEFVAALNRKEANIQPPFGFNRIITLSTIDSPLLPLLNVRYILALEDLQHPDLVLVNQERSTRVYEYIKAFPRVRLVQDIMLLSSKQAIFDAFYNGSINLQKTAIVQNDINISTEPLKPNESAILVSYVPDHLTIHTQLEAPRLVVIANMYDEGWKAYVDSALTSIYPANYIFQGVRVPAGDHFLELIR